MSKATSDPGTPIFGEVYSELELPEIDVHDFEWHEVDFPEGPAATRPPEVDDGELGRAAAPGESADEVSEQDALRGQDGVGESEQSAGAQGTRNEATEEASRQWTKAPAEESAPRSTTRSEERSGRRAKAESAEADQGSESAEPQHGGQSSNAAAEAVAGAAAAQRGGRRRKED
ncbi:hypothetical protein [Actinopolyspora saharensis]|uniref:hypothetical protein n=1 Tax=Actinopolyspora saharensis TaxID=995062 RepID=UPI003F66E911